MKESASCFINAAYGDPSEAGLPISIGVPFKRGELKEPGALSVHSPSGERRPAAGRTLAVWPDGSIRWCLVSFGAREAGAHAVRVEAAAPAPSGAAVTVTKQDDRWIVRSDRLELSVCETGAGVLGHLACDGHAYLSAPGDLSLNVDEASSLHEARRSVRVLEASPLRARLRVEGAHRRPDGSRLLNYRLDVEVWAGWPAVRLDYHYFNLEKGQAEQTVRRIALDSAWNLGKKTHRHFLQKNYGLFYISRHVYNPAPVALISDFNRAPACVEDPAMLLDDVDYPFYLHAPLVDSSEWLGVGDGERAVYGRIEDFTTAKPNRLASEGRLLSAEVWPARGGPLALPQGRSRRQTITLAFVKETSTQGVAKMSAAPVQAPKGVAAILTAPVHEGRASVNPEWIARCGEFKQDRVLPAGKHVRIEANLNSLVRLNMPNSKFDVGDTDSHYNDSYSTLGEVLVHRLEGAPVIPRIWPRSSPTQTYLDCHEPVWTNNEYDVIHAFCSEVMRTGKMSLWPTLRLAARHNIEVDFLHYSDHRWLHRATPAHSARHTTTGAYPSHFWTQGLLEYYCMTGDPDALEVALALGDKTVENFSEPELRAVSWGFNREIGWSVLSLACLVDVTGEARFKPLLEEMVNYLVAFDRAGYKGGINLSGGNDRQSLNRQIVGNFFGYGSMMEGVDLFADVTGRADVAEWLNTLCHDLADEALNGAREGEIRGIDFGLCLSIGHERTGDKRFMELAGLLLDVAYWNGSGIQGGGSAKPVASSYRALPRLLGHAWRAGLLEQYEFPSMRGR